jgi:hypothetical protein
VAARVKALSLHRAGRYRFRVLGASLHGAWNLRCKVLGSRCTVLGTYAAGCSALAAPCLELTPQGALELTRRVLLNCRRTVLGTYAARCSAVHSRCTVLGSGAPEHSAASAKHLAASAQSTLQRQHPSTSAATAQSTLERQLKARCRVSAKYLAPSARANKSPSCHSDRAGSQPHESRARSTS